MHKVLLIEDDEYLGDMIALGLEQEQFQVMRADNGTSGLEYACSESPDVIVLDVMLPGMDGYTLCTSLRVSSRVPIIMVSAQSSVDFRVNGLSAGADDYLCKPFSLKELIARIHSLIRRASWHEPLARDALRLDEQGQRLYVNGSPVELTGSEFELLRLFLSDPGKVFTRDEILVALKGSSQAFLVAERAVDVHITNLRRKIEPDHRKPQFIKTVWGSGYKYDPEGWDKHA